MIDDTENRIEGAWPTLYADGLSRRLGQVALSSIVGIRETFTKRSGNPHRRPPACRSPRNFPN